MTCYCGDMRCWSCGPAQGNYRCPACRKWSDDDSPPVNALGNSRVLVYNYEGILNKPCDCAFCMSIMGIPPCDDPEVCAKEISRMDDEEAKAWEEMECIEQEIDEYFRNIRLNDEDFHGPYRD